MNGNTIEVGFPVRRMLISNNQLYASASTQGTPMRIQNNQRRISTVLPPPNAPPFSLSQYLLHPLRLFVLFLPTQRLQQILAGLLVAHVDL